jgi:hypothetical protein
VSGVGTARKRAASGPSPGKKPGTREQRLNAEGVANPIAVGIPTAKARSGPR